MISGEGKWRGISEILPQWKMPFHEMKRKRKKLWSLQPRGSRCKDPQRRYTSKFLIKGQFHSCESLAWDVMNMCKCCLCFSCAFVQKLLHIKCIFFIYHHVWWNIRALSYSVTLDKACLCLTAVLSLRTITSSIEIPLLQFSLWMRHSAYPWRPHCRLWSLHRNEK